MALTSNLSITLVEQAQAQKEVTVNQAITKIDAVLNCGAIDKDIATPPGSPAEGDMYIIASGGTDDWNGHDGELTYFEQIWRFVSPNEGMRVFVNDENTAYVFDGSAWIPETAIHHSVIVTASSGSSLTLDIAAGTTQDITLDSSSVALSLSNPAASGKAGQMTIIIRQDGTGGRTITWPGSVLWAGGTAPTLSGGASAVDIFQLMTSDGGTSWFGSTLGIDMQ